MRKLISVLAALLVLIGTAPALITPAWASPRGNAFCKAAGSPAHLAELVQASLDKDPSGHTPLDAAACHEKRPATPDNFFVMFNLAGANLASVRDTPGYIRSLVPVVIHGKYRSACLAYRFDAHGKLEWYPLANCVARKLHHREVAWGDPVSHRPMLQSDCANPMQGPAQKSGCVDVVIPVKEGDEVRIHNTGPTDIAKDTCTWLLRAGETEWESPFVEHCPDPDCTFTGADEATDAKAWGIGSWVAKQDGYAIVREPAKVVLENADDYRLWVCVRQKDGTQSCGLGIRWFDYTRRDGARVGQWFQTESAKDVRIPKGDRMVAVIYRDEGAFKAAGSPVTRLNVPSVLWLDWTCDW